MTSEVMQWTTIVMNALVDVQKNPRKRVTIDVATEEAFRIVDDALFALITQGNEAAWRIELRRHTLH